MRPSLELGVTLVPYGCDLTIDSTDPSSPSVILGEETRMRLRRAIRTATHLPHKDFVCVLSAGFFIPAQRESMAAMMQAFLLDEGGSLFAGRIHSTEEEAGGSDAETRAALRAIQECNLPRYVVVVSSWYHLPRLWLLWQMNLGLARGRFIVRFIPCWYFGSPLRACAEIFKYAGTLVGLRASPFRSEIKER